MTRAPVLLLLAIALGGASRPRPVGLDAHIQRVTFQPDQVVELRGALGWQIMVEFGADERIENVSIGDAMAWQVTPNKRARNLFLKPLVAKASTNMTVVTSQRRYAFNLSAGPRSAYTPWIVQFDYPAPPVELTIAPPPSPPPVLDFGYARTGDASVLPARVWNDGRQTYFEFDEQTAIPAIFAIGPGKDEALVNVATRGRVQVVQQLGDRFVLRAGKQVATVTRTR